LEPAEPVLRSVWEDEPDETDQPAGAELGAAHDQPKAWATDGALAALLVPLCDAQDALARLDAQAAAAPAVVRDGLCARMAFAEAAGWLAHAHAWLHPLDIALHALGLTGSYSIATHVGRPMRDMPNTYIRRATGPWEDQDAEGMLSGDAAVAAALLLVRQLIRLARTREDPFGSLAMASAVINQFGPDVLDGIRFDQWRAEHVKGGEGGRLQLPPLLTAARIAEQWMTGGIVDQPNPLHALLAAAGVLVGSGALRTVIPPPWTAYPALGSQRAGRTEPCALPILRSDVAARLVQTGAASDWLLAFLVLLAEGARSATRVLDRLLEVAERGRGLIAGCDRRARLPAALDAVLRSSVLTPKGLAAELAITPQTATALLRELRTAELVTEITGRRSFRAFAIAGDGGIA
jgi:hypothetical protein